MKSEDLKTFDASREKQEKLSDLHHYSNFNHGFQLEHGNMVSFLLSKI